MKRLMKLAFAMQRFISPIPKQNKAFNCHRVVGSHAPIARVAIHARKQDKMK
jgi:hypothetical protein